MSIFKSGLNPNLVAVVTTIHKGIVNATPITWFTPCNYDPPLLFMSLKKDCDTLANIRDKQEFVLQTVPFEYAQEIHNLAAPCPREKSELEGTGLRLVESMDIETPRLEIAQEWFECTLMSLSGGGDFSHVFILAKVLYFSAISGESIKPPLLSRGSLEYLTISTEPDFGFIAEPYKGDKHE